MVRRLTVPKTLVVMVIGAATSLAVPACGDDDEEPMECTIEGDCPQDGRICLTEDTGAPCCPVCPVTPGECPSGCILEFPPV